MAYVAAKVFDAHNDLFQKRTEVMLVPSETQGQLTLNYENVQRLSITQFYRLVLEDGREGRILFNQITPSALEQSTATFAVVEPFSQR